MTQPAKGTTRAAAAELQALQLQINAQWERLVEAQAQLKDATNEIARIRNVVAAIGKGLHT